MKVTIDQQECISCAVCCADCPKVFEEDEVGGATQIVAAYRVDGDPTVGQIPDGFLKCVQAAADNCRARLSTSRDKCRLGG